MTQSVSSHGVPAAVRAGEFGLIARHFTRPTTHTVLAVGDDAALLAPRPGMQLAVSTDMLVAGTHFFPDTEPEALGWKALAVNLSDLAAMAAQPRWALLALALPEADEVWLAAFSAGFAACARAYQVDWVGGDTTRGPLNLCPTVIGELPAGSAVTRAGAQPGDDLWVSGQPGLAALGLRHLRDGLTLAPAWRAPCLQALTRPQPRVALGLALRARARAMLDVSDGLLGDLAHLLTGAVLGAELDAAALPLAALQAACGDALLAQSALFAGGDDYELLFAAPPAQAQALRVLAAELGLPLTRIGHLRREPGLFLCHPDGRREPLAVRGYDHFVAVGAPSPNP